MGQIYDTDGTPIQRLKPLANTDNLLFRGVGFSATATKTTSTDVEYEIVEERLINGVQLILNNHVVGDSADFKVVDKNNVLGYGAGVVLNVFGSGWLVSPSDSQPMIVLPYPANLYAGLFIRIVYHSIGTVNDVFVGANLFLHKKQ